MDLTKLAEPFNPEDVEWRISRCGRKDGKVWANALAYITSRAIHDRLDEVVGPDGWQLSYKTHDISDKEGPNHGTIAVISIFTKNGWVSKEGGAGATDIESFKGSLSDAEKRAGVPWGIGRYLYHLEETFVKCSSARIDGWHYATGRDGSDKFTFYWEKPTLPEWALPAPPERDDVKPETEKNPETKPSWHGSVPDKKPEKKEPPQKTNEPKTESSDEFAKQLENFKRLVLKKNLDLAIVKKNIANSFKGDSLKEIIRSNYTQIMEDIEKNPDKYNLPF